MVGSKRNKAAAIAGALVAMVRTAAGLALYVVAVIDSHERHMHLQSGETMPVGRTGERRAAERDATAMARTARVADTSPASNRLTVRDILGRPLPFKGPGDRVLIRAIALLAKRQVRAVFGVEKILPACDPFILAISHNTKREAVFVPTLLIFHRGGRLIHIWSDWIYRLIPGAALVLRRAGTIVVTGKPARRKVLNWFKRFYLQPMPAMERARAHLLAGRSVGVFPEGGISRDPRRLLPGRFGTARLSLETGVPIVPVGIRFPGADLNRPIPENATMEVHVGPALKPPAVAGAKPPIAAVRAWHATMMTEIARLSGKTWRPRSDRANGSMPLDE